MKKTTKILLTACGLTLIAFAAIAAVPGGTSNIAGLLKIITAPGATLTCSTATAAGELCVSGDIESNGNLDIAGTSTLTGAVTLTAASTASTSLTTPILASGLYVVRFCGNLPGSGTAATSYISPVPEATLVSGVANYEFGGTGCDGEDSATVGTADEVLTAVTMTPVAIKCAAICTGATTVNDTTTFTVTDDGTAVVGGPTATITMAADATLYQSTGTLTPGATPIAGNSAIAVKMVNTNDDCDDAGDDVECFVTFAVN